MIATKISQACLAIIFGLAVVGATHATKQPPAITFNERFGEWQPVTVPEPEPPQVSADVPQDTLWQMGKGYVWGRCAVLSSGRTLCKWDEAAI